MSKITVETIQGKPYTVVWREPEIYPCDADDTGWIDGVSNGELFGQDAYADDYIAIATALPALPRHPKPEDAPLLYRYMAEGIVPMATEEDFHNGCDLSNLAFIDSWRTGKGMKITHATHNGERVEIAITDEAHNG